MWYNLGKINYDAKEDLNTTASQREGAKKASLVGSTT